MNKIVQEQIHFLGIYFFDFEFPLTTFLIPNINVQSIITLNYNISTTYYHHYSKTTINQSIEISRDYDGWRYDIGQIYEVSCSTQRYKFVVSPLFSNKENMANFLLTLNTYNSVYAFTNLLYFMHIGCFSTKSCTCCTSNEL